MTDFNTKRYFVRDRFPTSCHTVGTILSEKEMNFDMGQYPNLYRILQWWEYRTPEEMPTYVEKLSEGDGYHVKGDFLLVEQWMYRPPNFNFDKEFCRWIAKVGQHYYNAAILLPKTQEQYNKAPKEKQFR